MPSSGQVKRLRSGADADACTLPAALYHERYVSHGGPRRLRSAVVDEIGVTPGSRSGERLIRAGGVAGLVRSCNGGGGVGYAGAGGRSGRLLASLTHRKYPFRLRWARRAGAGVQPQTGPQGLNMGTRIPDPPPRPQAAGAAGRGLHPGSRPATPRPRSAGVATPTNPGRPPFRPGAVPPRVAFSAPQEIRPAGPCKPRGSARIIGI